MQANDVFLLNCFQVWLHWDSGRSFHLGQGSKGYLYHRELGILSYYLTQTWRVSPIRSDQYHLCWWASANQWNATQFFVSQVNLETFWTRKFLCRLSKSLYTYHQKIYVYQVDSILYQKVQFYLCIDEMSLNIESTELFHYLSSFCKK